jgi:hypothetical protein
MKNPIDNVADYSISESDLTDLGLHVMYSCELADALGKLMQVQKKDNED